MKENRETEKEINSGKKLEREREIKEGEKVKRDKKMRKKGMKENEMILRGRERLSQVNIS